MSVFLEPALAFCELDGQLVLLAEPQATAERLCRLAYQAVQFGNCHVCHVLAFVVAAVEKNLHELLDLPAAFASHGDTSRSRAVLAQISATACLH